MEHKNKTVPGIFQMQHRKDWRFIFRHPIIGLKYFKGIGSNIYQLKPEIYDEYIRTKIEKSNFEKVFMEVIDANSHQYLNKKTRILDMCCGTAIFARGWISRLNQYYIEYTGVDVNQSFLDYANEKLPDKSRFRFVYGDAATIKLDAKFDIAVATSSYHHIEDERKVEFLRNIYEHLEGNGILIIYEKTVAPFYTAKQAEKSGIDFYNKRIKYLKKTEKLSAKQLFALKNEMYLTAIRKEEYKVSDYQLHEDLLLAGFVVKGSENNTPQLLFDCYGQVGVGDEIIVAAKR